MISPISDEEYSYSFLFWPNMITATSTLQSTLSSCAFLNRPPLRFRNVLSHCQHDAIEQARTKTYTDLFLSSLMRLISILRRPMMNLRCCAVTDCGNGWWSFSDSVVNALTKLRLFSDRIYPVPVSKQYPSSKCLGYSCRNLIKSRCLS